MVKKLEQRRTKPDEAFRHGPISVARYGNNIVHKSDWGEVGFAEMQKRALEEYPAIVKKINELVQDIASLVQELPAEKLLQRAWFSLAASIIGIQSEEDVDDENMIGHRMIDYIQSVIASVPASNSQESELSDNDWQSLREKVKSLFYTLSVDYQICRTAKARIEDENFNIDEQEFYFRAQLYWCNVTGQRYQAHEIAHLRDLLTAHSKVLEELFGISSDQLINELEKILLSLTFGLEETIEELHSFHDDSSAAIKEKIETTPPDNDLPPHMLMQEIIDENKWHSRQKRVMGRFFGTDLFDVQMITSLPKSLIEELSWKQGEESTFFEPGDFRGWPLRIWPISKRPFICLNDRYYCFHLPSLFDNVYRVMQRTIQRLKPEYSEDWNTTQQQVSEELPFTYLQRVLRGATVHRSVFYRWYPDSTNASKQWCETDGLLIYDDHLFIIEVRAGAFTYTPPATDFTAFLASLKNLAQKPASQGNRFLNYIESEDTAPIYDRNHEKIGEICKTNFRQITICPVTIDPFTEMAAKVQHLNKVGIDVGTHPVWVISLDDLRVYAEIFENPLHFLHYVEQRMQAFKSDLVNLDDELDHLGLYLKHNNYSKYTASMKGKSNAIIQFIGYRSEIDEFFRNRLLDATIPCTLKQIAPSRIQEIVTFLSSRKMPGRTGISSYILDLDETTRQQISSYIDNELQAQLAGRPPKPCSTHGGVDFTVFCYRKQNLTRRESAHALDHARAVLLVNNDKRRLFLKLNYTEEHTLADVHWQWVTRQEIPEMDIPRLRRAADGLRKSRIATSKAKNKKIGRNELCPCGSGKKYKKCCLITQ